jgi:hypothetical protein
MTGVPGDFAAEVYQQMDGVGWIDGAGRNVDKFRGYLASRWSKEKRTKTANGVSQSVQMIADGKEIERITARIKTIKDQASQTAMGSSYTDDQKAELNKLIERRKELRKRTGAMI